MRVVIVTSPPQPQSLHGLYLCQRSPVHVASYLMILTKAAPKTSPGLPESSHPLRGPIRDHQPCRRHLKNVSSYITKKTHTGLGIHTFWQIVALPTHDSLEGPDCVLEIHQQAVNTRKDLRNRERLAQESLQLSCSLDR